MAPTVTYDLSGDGPVSIGISTDGAMHREVRNPGDDLSDLPKNVRLAIEEHWTPERIAALEAEQEKVRLSEKPTAENIVAERARRLSLGFDYDFGDERGTHRIGTTPADMKGWEEVTTIANAMIATGNSSAAIDIVTDTGPAAITALEWQSILLAAAAFRQPVWVASFVLQAIDPVPDDYADDARWPLSA